MSISMSMSMSIYIAHYRTVPLMRSMRRILLKQVGLQQATEAGDAEFWITQVVAQCVPDGRTNHGELMTAVRVKLYSWHDEWAAARRTKVLSFGDLGDRRTQLGQVVRRLAVKTLMHRHTGLERDPICHIEPVQLSMTELSQTAVVFACGAHHSRCSIHGMGHDAGNEEEAAERN